MPAVSEFWFCSNCGEKIETKFDRCWKCHEARSDEESSQSQEAVTDLLPGEAPSTVRYSSSATLTKEVVVNEWSMIVEKAGDKVEQVFKDTEDNIKNSKAPDVNFERVRVSPSFLAGALGDRRAFLRITHKRLPKYEMYIGVREYGIHLDLVWYLTYEPGIFESIINMILSVLKRKRVFSMSLFDEHDLTVYTTVVHHCFLQAVEKITKGTGQEINKTSKGFLGIS